MVSYSGKKIRRDKTRRNGIARIVNLISRLNPSSTGDKTVNTMNSGRAHPVHRPVPVHSLLVREPGTKVIDTV